MAKYDMVPRYLDMIAYRKAVEVSIETRKTDIEEVGARQEGLACSVTSAAGGRSTR